MYNIIPHVYAHRIPFLLQVESFPVEVEVEVEVEVIAQHKQNILVVKPNSKEKELIVV